MLLEENSELFNVDTYISGIFQRTHIVSKCVRIADEYFRTLTVKFLHHF